MAQRGLLSVGHALRRLMLSEACVEAARGVDYRVEVGLARGLELRVLGSAAIRGSLWLRLLHHVGCVLEHHVGQVELTLLVDVVG